MVLAWSDTATGMIVLGVVVVVALIWNRTLNGKFGNLQFTLGKQTKTLESIDRSVNHREEGESTVSEDVAHIKAQLESIVLPTLKSHAARLDVLESA